MTTSLATPLDGGRKLIVAVMGVALIAMLATSFMYRMNHPSLVMEGREQRPAAMDGPADESAMLAALMQRVQENPTDAAALLTLGEHFMTHEEWQRAEMFLKRAVIAAPSEPRGLYLLGFAQYHKGEHAVAAETFERMLVLEEDAAARFNLGMLYIHYLNEPAKGYAYLQKVESNPKAESDVKEHVAQELAAARKSGKLK